MCVVGWLIGQKNRPNRVVHKQIIGNFKKCINFEAMKYLKINTNISSKFYHLINFLTNIKLASLLEVQNVTSQPLKLENRNSELKNRRLIFSYFFLGFKFNFFKKGSVPPKFYKERRTRPFRREIELPFYIYFTRYLKNHIDIGMIGIINVIEKL